MFIAYGAIGDVFQARVNKVLVVFKFRTVACQSGQLQDTVTICGHIVRQENPLGSCCLGFKLLNMPLIHFLFFFYSFSSSSLFAFLPLPSVVAPQLRESWSWC